MYNFLITSLIKVTVHGLNKEDYLQMFQYVSFWLHSCCMVLEGLARKLVYHKSRMNVVTLTLRPNEVGP